MEEWTFADEIQLSTLNLPRAALLFARELAYPDLTISIYLQQIETLVCAARAEIRPHDDVATQAEVLSEFLFQREGFHGNSDEYGDPRNSFLNDLLERRLGIPISLSVLYLAVARRLKLPAYGVGMPGHFIVMVRTDTNPLYFDPFNGGGRLSIADCSRLIQSTTGYMGPLRSEWLTSVDNRTILTRMLNNLRLTYMESRMWPQAAKTIDLLRTMHPQTAEFLRDLGVVHYQAGAMHLAAHYLNAYLQHEPDAPDAAAIRKGIAQPLDAWVKLN